MSQDCLIRSLWLSAQNLQNLAFVQYSNAVNCCFVELFPLLPHLTSQ